MPETKINIDEFRRKEPVVPPVLKAEKKEPETQPIECIYLEEIDSILDAAKDWCTELGRDEAGRRLTAELAKESPDIAFELGKRLSVTHSERAFCKAGANKATANFVDFLRNKKILCLEIPRKKALYVRTGLIEKEPTSLSLG